MFTNNELERAAYIKGDAALAALYARLEDAENTIDRQAADLDCLRHQLQQAYDLMED